MENDFLKIWFGGFEQAVQEMKPAQRDDLFRPCAKACSDSYPALMFAEAYAGAADRGEFLDRLQILMKGLSIEKKDDGRAIFSYPCCYCDLYNMGYLSSPILCECSRLNLIANFESVMGKGCVEVTLLQSILGGAESCELEVRFLR
ncbi:MAG: hypothetical protein GX099_04675 [Clostridiaceae bacterium]|nr:hypothetical protein [Oscillospiraceae bacterium]NLO62707.1 hypothetical protein [Clostridiaceae bacterium]